MAKVKRSKRLIVQEHAPWRKWAWVAVFSTLFGLATYALYSYTISRLPYEWEQLEVERAKLESDRKEMIRTIRQLKYENKRLAEEKVLAERSVEIDRESAKALQDSLQDMQAELDAKEEQLAFYRGIVSPDQSKAGLRIYDFEVRDAGESNLYLFDLILIQAVRHDKTVSGQVSVEIRGTKGGEEVRLPLKQLSLAADKRLSFSFRYFQDLRGAFRLPKGFRPGTVHIRVDVSGSSAAVEKDIQWSVVKESTGA